MHQVWQPGPAGGGVSFGSVRLQKPPDGQLSDEFLRDVSDVYRAAR